MPYNILYFESSLYTENWKKANEKKQQQKTAWSY